MASSGTNTFNLSVDELILEAYERCGVTTPTGYQLRSARRSLNLLLQDLGNRDVHLFKRAQTTFNTVESDETYVLDAAILDVMDMHILSGGSNGSEISMARYTQSEYAGLPNKSTEARPSHYYLDRERDAATLYLYPSPDAVYTINYFAYNRIQDVGDYTNTLDVPARFLPAVTTGLAFMLSETLPALDVPRVSLFKQRYDEEVLRAIEEDEERVSLYLTPNLAGSGFAVRTG
mgnify:FL=1